MKRLVLVLVLVLGLVFSAQAGLLPGFLPMGPQTPALWPAGAQGQVTYQSFFGMTSFNFMGQGLVPGSTYELVAETPLGFTVCLGSGVAATGAGQGNSTMKAGFLNLYGMVKTLSLPKGKLSLLLVPVEEVDCGGNHLVNFNPDLAFFGTHTVTFR
jgi:hypothetical protein